MSGAAAFAQSSERQLQSIADLTQATDALREIAAFMRLEGSPRVTEATS
jgi:hypothetical protein